jgi:hypothetical protein
MKADLSAMQDSPAIPNQTPHLDDNKTGMRNASFRVLLGCAMAIQFALAQNPPSQSVRTVPTFIGSFVTNGKQYSYTVAGQRPESGGTTTIPTVLVPLSLSFEASGRRSKHKPVMNAEGDVSKMLHSPIFRKFAFATGASSMATPCSARSFIRRRQRPGGTHCLGSRIWRRPFRSIFRWLMDMYCAPGEPESRWPLWISISSNNNCSSIWRAQSPGRTNLLSH